MEYFIYCFKHYADFSGRARRKEFWFFVLFNVLITLILGSLWVIWMAIGSPTFPSNIPSSVFFNPFFFILFIYFLASIIPLLAVGTRRLHDIGKSGKWMLLCIIFTHVKYNNTLMLSFVIPFWNIIKFILQIAIFLIGIVWLSKDSESGPNKYGLNPKGEGNAVETEQQPTETEQSE